MKRTLRISSFGGRHFGDSTTAQPRLFRAGLEQLEDRKLLSVNDLLISTYDSFYGQTVLRFHDTSWTPAAGGVATGGAENAGTAYGMTSAPDGSFYVSSNAAFPGEILHYDVAGNFVDVLGDGDATPISAYSPYFVPATLQFGPNGHLYVGDFGSNSILEFDTTSQTQQFLIGDAHYLGYRPGGFTFASDGSDDLIVGAAEDHTVIRYDADDFSPTVLIDPDDAGVDFDIINISSILARPNNDLLIADFTFGGDEEAHHRIIKYDASEETVSDFIILTDPVGTGMGFEGFPAQPLSMLYEPGEETFLVGVSADHSLNGAILRFDSETGAQVGDPVLSNIPSPTALAYTAVMTSTVDGRNIFYNNSAFDGGSAAIDFVSDNAAIATDKTAYLPNDTTAVFSNVTSYTKGINGIVIDLAAGGNHAGITASDFVFKVGNNNLPSSWAAAPAPAAVAVSLGGGVSGSDRVEITWADNSITNKWLEVQVLVTANTGLPTADVFFWGSKVGDTGNPSATDFSTTVSGDGGDILTHLGSGGGVANTYDINRSNSVTVSGDRGDVVANLGSITRLKVGSGGPFAPQGGGNGSGGDAGVASALAATTTSSTETAAPTAPIVAPTLEHSDLNRARIVAYFRHLAEEDARPRRILVEAERIAEALGLDDELLDVLAHKLKHDGA